MGHIARHADTVRSIARCLIMMPLWIEILLHLQAIALEEFEYYAAYGSSGMELLLDFLTFKPLEILFEWACEQGLSLSSRYQ